MKIDLKNKYHLFLILTISVICFMSAMVVLSPYTKNPRDLDADADTILDEQDNCPNIPNFDQSDIDDDGIGDVCDSCTDTDNDGYGNPGYPQNTCPDDNCPDTANANQTDIDHDLIGDVCDRCPDDSLNDADADGICGGVDNCPGAYNPEQKDTDSDGIGDACEMPPTADFLYRPSEPIQGELIQFTDTTTSGGGALQQWKWMFGDNMTSIEQHPTHQYMTIGIYTVQLNVIDINGKTSQIEKQVTVIPNNPPTPPIITGPTFGRVEINYTYQLTATDPNGNHIYYKIEWGDNTTTGPLGPYPPGIEIMTNHSWKHPGRYLITILAIDTHQTESIPTSRMVHITNLYLLDQRFFDFFKQDHQLFLFWIINM